MEHKCKECEGDMVINYIKHISKGVRFLPVFLIFIVAPAFIYFFYTLFGLFKLLILLAVGYFMLIIELDIHLGLMLQGLFSPKWRKKIFGND